MLLLPNNNGPSFIHRSHGPGGGSGVPRGSSAGGSGVTGGGELVQSGWMRVLTNIIKKGLFLFSARATRLLRN